MTLQSVLEKLDYYRWRVNMLRCYFRHDFKNVYTRVSMDGHYSGKEECQRCYESKYFSGDFKS